MDLRPLHDRVMVRRLDEGEQLRGGIIIPDTAKEKPQQAEVVAAGNGKLLVIISASAYDTWIAGFPSIAPADRGPASDPDHDGSSNLVEFALGGTPNSGSSRPAFTSVPITARPWFTWAMSGPSGWFIASGRVLFKSS